jgi:hypothetical protein
MAIHPLYDETFGRFLDASVLDADERWQFIRFTIDHVLPLSAGGSDGTDNLALACRNCNERRGNRSEGRDPETGHVVPVFNHLD